jgi:hypothetical protein
MLAGQRGTCEYASATTRNCECEYRRTRIIYVLLPSGWWNFRPRVESALEVHDLGTLRLAARCLGAGPARGLWTNLGRLPLRVFLNR